MSLGVSPLLVVDDDEEELKDDEGVNLDCGWSLRLNRISSSSLGFKSKIGS